MNHHFGRVSDFATEPTVTLSEIKAKYEYFEKICTDDEIKNPSILIPDVGAGLLYSRLKIYDAAGLCDPFIAKNSKNVAGLRDYVLEDIRPDIISLHGRWSLQFSFWVDNRFYEQYRVLNQFQDSALQKGEMIYFSSGDYMRRNN